jgi:hypothetical protein
MKTRTGMKLAACALLVIGLSNRPAEAQVGLAAGLNFDSFSDIDAGSGRATFDNASGYHVGLFFDLAAGPVALRPGLFYRNVRDVTFSVSEIERTFDLSLIEVPVDVRVRMAAIPLIRPYALAGPVFSFASSTDPDYDEILKNLLVSANIGLGVEISVPATGIRLFPEVRYAFGISRLTREEEFNVGGVTIRPEEGQSLNTLMLRLGITI